MPTYPNRYSEDEVHRIEPDSEKEPEPDATVLEEAPRKEPEPWTEETEDKKRQKKAKTIKFYSYTILAFIVLFIVLTNCFVRVEVVGDSMEPAYSDKQIIWANRWRKPFYNCVVILSNPYYGTKDKEPETVLKRVKGFGGDEFWIDSENNLWRQSGEVSEIIQENIGAARVLSIINFSDIFSGYDDKYIVPADCVFVLGDNYNISEDSRYYGAVPKNTIKGVIY